MRDIDGLADYAVSQSKNGKSISFEGVSQLNNDYIAKQAHGFVGVNAAIKEYNNLKKDSIDKANKFAETIGKSNANLGKYLTGLKSTTGGMGGYALSLVGATAKTVALEMATMALNTAISFGVSFAISGLISLITSASKAREEEIAKAKEAASEANALGDEIATLASKYITLSEAVKTDAGAKEDLISTQAELLEKLGLEGESIDDLIEKYGSLSNAIKQASIDSLKNSQLDLIAGVNAAKDELLDIGADGFFGGNNIINATGDDAVKAFKELEKAGVVGSGSYGSGGGSLVLIGDDTTTEGILTNYQKLEDALNALRDSNAFVGSELTDNSLYQAIYARYDEMKEKVDAYKTSIGDLNENLAQQTMLTALQGSELPKSEQEFETFKQQLIDTAVASKQFIGNEKEIADSINSYLSKVPEFAEYFNLPLEDGAKNLDKMTVSLDEFNKEVDEIQNAYSTLKGAVDEYNSSGYMSLDTVQKLLSLEPQYLAMLVNENGQLSLNKQAMRNLLEERLKETKAKIYESGINQLNALTAAKTGEASEKAADKKSDAVDNIKEETDALNENTEAGLKNAASKALEAGVSQEDINAIVDSTMAAAKGLQSALDGLDINFDRIFGGTSSSKSSSKNKALEIIKDLEHQIYLIKELKGEYADVVSYYDKIQEIAHTEADRLRSIGYDDNSDEIQDLQKKWWDAQNSKLDFYNKQHENIIRDIEHARDMALSSNPFADTTSYYKQMQDEYNKQIERLRKLSPEKYKEEIQELEQSWQEAQKAIAELSFSNAERWIDERNTYNDWESYADNEVAAWERVLKIFKTEFPKELEKIKEIEEKIFEVRKDAMEKAISDIEDYIDARNSYNDWDAYGDSEVKAIQRQTKIIEEAYKERLLSFEEYIDKLEEYSQRIHSLGQSRVDKHLSNIDKYIDARNTYNDWDAFNDSEIKAIQRQLAVLDEAYKLNLISLEEYTEKSAEYTQKLYSTAKNNIIETISKLIEDYEEIKQGEIDSLQFASDQKGALKTLLQSYYDVINAVADAQHEINKELVASQTMYEYLNEETRELLFNQEDYNELNEKLVEIRADADALQKQYQEDILGASEETLAEITSQYQMQYETMMKQYEIAKAELDVAKKRQKLNNVLAERKVRMFINGKWQWVANTQDVIDAEKELAEAELEKEKAEASLEQVDSINKLTEAQDDITTQINYLNSDLETIRDKWSEMQKMLNGEAEDVAEALREISNVSSPELRKVIEATGGSVDSFSASLSESTAILSDTIRNDFSYMSTNVGNIVNDLRSYSEAIQSLTAQIRGAVVNPPIENNTNQQPNQQPNQYMNNAEATLPNGSRVPIYIDSSGKTQTSGLPVGTIVHSGGGDFAIIGGYGGNYSSIRVNGNAIQVGSSGNAPAGTAPGTIIHTGGGDYLVVPPYTDGAKYNPINGLYSIKIGSRYATGTRYTSGRMTLMGENGLESFIDSSGHYIPINQPTIGNIGAGGIVFNREQMANLRNLWDLSNLSRVTPFASSSNANSQSTVIDNSIHINGLTVSEQGNEDWINGLRRYVATHK